MKSSAPCLRPVRSLAIVLVVGALAAATFSSPLQAIPPFARKYGTSCQTCHIAYPKLNAFGEAFRLLGYHMPEETEAQIKQPDVPLGAEAYKRVWPDAVWPGMIPAHLPVGLTADFLVQDSTMTEGDDVEKVKWDFAFPSEAALVAGGSAGDNVSYFGEIGFEREVEDGEVNNEVGVEHFDVRFIRPIHDSIAFNFKVGAFQPEIVNTFDHARRLTITNYDSMFAVGTAQPGGAAVVGGGGHHGGGNGIALPPIAQGVEGYGVVAHRLFWNAGVVNGLGPGEHAFDGNSSKDLYGRVAYKWGGLAPDGSNAATFVGSPKNWREKSLRVGAFAYHGDGSSIFFPAMGHDESLAYVEDTTFTRWGVDVNWFYEDLNVFGAFVDGRDDLSTFAADVADPTAPGALIGHQSGEFTYRAWFLEADAVMRYPWLHGALRYESVDLPGSEDGVPAESWERATASATALIRANVKATAEYVWDLNETKNNATLARLAIAF